MAENQADQLGKAVFDAVGGPNNIVSLIHCMTRVRMTIRDYNKVDLAQLKAIPGVLGVVEDETLQVVIGPGKVNKVAQSMVDQVGVKLGEPFPTKLDSRAALLNETEVNKQKAKAKYDKPSRLKQILKAISNIFVPLIPAFVGAGMIAGIASILQNMMTAGTIDPATWTPIITVLNVIKNGIFAYLSLYTGINAASEFGATPALGGVIGATTLLAGMDPKAPIINLFDGQSLLPGQGGIIGVILAVWLLSLLEKRLHKWVPDSLDIIIVPTITLLVMGLVTIFLIMPIAGVVSNSLVGAINAILQVGGGFAGFVLGALFLPMVMFGLHQILTPIHLEMIAKTGSTQLLPVLAMAGAGQVGAAIALWIKLRKNRSLVEKIKGALPVGILGIGEPLIYAVTLPMGRPFITACIGGGIGGAIIGTMGNVGAIAIGPSGVALVPLIAKGNWWIYVIGLLGAYAGGFIVTYLFGIPKDELVKANHEPVAASQINLAEKEVNDEKHSQSISIKAPVTGQLVALSSLADDVLANGMMGEGIAIEPETNLIVSPIDGTVETIFPTKHAIGLRGKQGEELLIHIGIDTVKLEGEGFEKIADEGQDVSVGTPLVRTNIKKMRDLGYTMTIAVIVLENGGLTKLEEHPIGYVQVGDEILKLESSD